MPIRLLKKLTSLSLGSRRLLDDRFIDEVNEDIDVLNQQINAYNTEAHANKRLKLLKKLYQQWKVVSNKYNTDFITAFAAYQEQIHKRLYNDIKTAFHECGIPSLFDMDGTLSLTNTPRAFSEFLMNMSPEKVSSMLSLLSAGALWTESAFETLYRRGEPGYEDFQRLLRTHSIRFLGGYNSKNFKVKCLDPTNPLKFVLKVDNRLGMPRSVEAHLRENGLDSIFTKVYAERQATYQPIGTGTITTSTLLLTEYCKGKDLTKHAQLRSNPQERILSAITIYSQMALILLKIKEKDCLFPDPKNTNWLFDEKGMVRIADTKSFVYAKGSAGLKFWRTRFVYGDLLRDWCDLLGTSHMNPPEISGTHLQKNKISVDKCHAYMLGKNLYQYLSRCSDAYLLNKHDGATYDFSSRAFSGVQGGMLKSLIIRLINPNPKARMKLRDITSTLASMYKESAQQQCTFFSNEIEALGWGSDDTPMCDYLRRVRGIIRQTTTHGGFIALAGELNGVLTALKAIPISTYLKDIESWGEDRTDGMKLIATSILAEIKRIPIDERRLYKLPTSSINRLSKQLKDTLEAHRANVRQCRTIVRDLSLQWGHNSPLMREFCLIKQGEINNAVDLNVLKSTLEKLQTVHGDIGASLLRLEAMVASLTRPDGPLLQEALNRVRRIFDSIPIGKRFEDSKELLSLKSLLGLLEKQASNYKLLQQIQSYAIRDSDSLILSFITNQRCDIQSKTKTDEQEKIQRELTSFLGIIEKRVSNYLLLQQIQPYAIRGSDSLMLSFITNKQHDIQSKTKADEHEQIRQELVAVLAGLQDTMPEINGFIHRFHTKATAPLSRGMSQKEHLIEEAIRQIPPEQRTKAWLRSSRKPEAARFRESLAFHRHLGRRSLYRDSYGNLDESKAAGTYQQFFDIVKPTPDSFYLRCLDWLTIRSFSALLVVLLLLSPILVPLTIVASAVRFGSGLFSKAAPNASSTSNGRVVSIHV